MNVLATVGIVALCVLAGWSVYWILEAADALIRYVRS
jgi:hypothetical protein